MCGIGGWICFGPSRPPEVVPSVLSILESRGRDASGVAYGKWGSEMWVIKNPVPGSKLFEEKAARKYLSDIYRADVVLMHTRAQTQGAKENNKNNHPVFQKGGKYILVHNGQISNDDELFHTDCPLGLKRQAEVDTEALAALLDTGSSPDEASEKLGFATGSYAIAATPMMDVDHVIFARNHSPLCLLYDQEKDILFFGSTVESLEPYFSLCDKAIRRGIVQIRMGQAWGLEDHEALVVTKEGALPIQKIKPNFDHHIGKYTRRWGQTSYGFSEEDNWMRGLGRGPASADTPTVVVAPPSSTAPIFRVPKVTFKDPLAGRIQEDRVYVSIARGFIGLPSIGTQLSMRTFPNKAFPKVSPSEGPEVRVKCPACWISVVAQELQQRSYNCPRCHTNLDKPEFFRVLSDGEHRAGYFREVGSGS